MTIPAAFRSRAPRRTTPAAAALLLLAAGAPVGAQQPASQQPASQQIRRAYALAPDGAVRVFVLAGRVRVVGTDVDSVVVTGTAPAGQQFHGGGTLRGVKVGLWDETAAAGAAGAASASSRLEVRVPRRSRVWVKAGQTADVEAEGVAGGLDLNIVGGAVRVRGAPRELNVEAMDGSVEVAGSPAWLRVKTASGAITLRGASEDVALATVSGAIRVVDGRVTRGRFESVTGDIRFDGAAERGGALTFDSHSGRVALALPRAASLDVQVTTILGTVENALSGARAAAGREARGRELSFVTGDGLAATVTVRSFKGPVTLVAR